ncbi:methyltransferase family protein [Deinococcus frigens]|uniref:methyltransferase family protein n=1 Tax=Deinococcus frigens TaxID=249403 RepID=UPI000496A67E|nr:isoprenylcysteine carboxylmethyltransferase family protein [Deinococcus frigens]
MTAQSRFRRFRQRGGALVAAQFALIGLVFVGAWRGGRVSRLQKGAGLTLVVLGGAVVVGGGRSLGQGFSVMPEPTDTAQLVTDGLYARVRHPIYSSLLAISLGWALFWGSREALGWTVALAALLHFKSAREETALLARFPHYAAYRRRTKRFVPGVV